MVKFIKVNGIASHEVLIIPVSNMLFFATSSTTETTIRYNTVDSTINIITITHAAMANTSVTTMLDWLTESFISANQQPWSQPMYNVQASDAPFLISNIVLS